MRKLFVETANFRRVYSNIAEVSHRASGLPGIAVVVAPPGFGKTWSCVRTVDSIGAIYTSAKAGWAKSWMLSDVCRELGIPPTSRCQVMFNDIVEALRKINGVLVVDEADYLPRRPETMEVLRDIHDHSGAALVFVGTEQFMFGLQKYPQISGRVMRWVELEDLSLDDTRLLSEKFVDSRLLMIWWRESLNGAADRFGDQRLRSPRSRPSRCAIPCRASAYRNGATRGNSISAQLPCFLRGGAGRLPSCPRNSRNVRRGWLLDASPYYTAGARDRASAIVARHAHLAPLLARRSPRHLRRWPDVRSRLYRRADESGLSSQSFAGATVCLPVDARYRAKAATRQLRWRALRFERLRLRGARCRIRSMQNFCQRR